MTRRRNSRYFSILGCILGLVSLTQVPSRAGAHAPPPPAPVATPVPLTTAPLPALLPREPLPPGPAFSSPSSPPVMERSGPPPVWGLAALGAGLTAGVIGAVTWARDGHTTICDEHLCARHTAPIGMTLVGAGCLLTGLGIWILYASPARPRTAMALGPGSAALLGTF